ncbi:hypothetical protein FB45DRAFT_214915 [Roridomyces roridus]|uniref:Uncharacterized protein n=1 Tax=Roridomyces roridus TaxID=1738132 RepID=A0AAD7FGS2_9AGAR|nr:hypothetical protein FB45DRAFT_214915 [Roridomyces roridus]
MVRTRWIRQSSGQICVDLGLYYHGIQEPRSNFALSDFGPNRDNKYTDTSDARALEALSIHQVHRIAWHEFPTAHINLDKPLDLRLGGIFRTGPDIGVPIEVAYLPGVSFDVISSDYHGMSAAVMENGWRRLVSYQSYEESVWLHFEVAPEFDAWISQANYIFKQLQITSDFHDYVYIDGCVLELKIPSSGTKARPDGYLFLCPLDHYFRVPEHSGYFQLPECPWFWSFDPQGQSRLTAEEAEIHGFPTMEMHIKVWGKSWDASVYEALRQLHAAKGFDPDSQELAIHLGQPLFQLSCELEESLAYVDDEVPETPGVDKVGEELTASPVLPQTVADVPVQQGRTSGFLSALCSWEIPEFGSLC